MGVEGVAVRTVPVGKVVQGRSLRFGRGRVGRSLPAEIKAVERNPDGLFFRRSFLCRRSYQIPCLLIPDRLPDTTCNRRLPIL